MKKRLPRFITLALLSLFVIASLAMTPNANLLEEDGITQQNYDAAMSLEEILNDINERYGTDFKTEPQSARDELHTDEIYYSGSELEALIGFYEETAKRILENNALVERLWYERTGIPIEEAILQNSFDNPLISDDLSSFPFTLTRSTAPYVSQKDAWDPYDWISTHVIGIVNTASPKTFYSTQFMVSCQGSRTVQTIWFINLTVESYHGDSHAAVLFNSDKSVAIYSYGTLRIAPPIGSPTTSSITVYTEFYADSP